MACEVPGLCSFYIWSADSMKSYSNLNWLLVNKKYSFKVLAIHNWKDFTKHAFKIETNFISIANIKKLLILLSSWFRFVLNVCGNGEEGFDALLDYLFFGHF